MPSSCRRKSAENRAPTGRTIGGALFLSALLALSTPSHAQATLPPSACIEGATVVPLLGGQGDAPLIPVHVEDQDAAMFVSPGLRPVLIRNYGDIWFPLGPAQPLIAQDGQPVITHHTEIDDIRIGTLSLSMVPASLLEHDATRMVGTRPLLGLLGYEFFIGAELLLDIPHGKLAIFHWSTKKECGDSPARIFAGAFTSVKMDSTTHIAVQIGPITRQFKLDPDLGISIIPYTDARDAGISKASLAEDTRIATCYATTQVGARHRFDRVAIGSHTMTDIPLVVQNHLSTGALGEDFFSGIVALFDFPHNRFIFQPTTDRNTAPERHLHFDESHEGFTSVKEPHPERRYQ
ncbi:aspartyl protease family protein [Gluconacetobacter sp. Hr-1-5]|uniref:aspartyl protease family protein n=1 Tax=Gluconacetobacter sp. Hr-1-5 TaxID=3395370 RepID=UPI003B521430